MKYYVYALKSVNHSLIYVGLTNNLVRRISQHNKGQQKSTKHYRPLRCIYAKKYSTRIEARQGEIYYKSGCGKEFLKRLT